MSSEIRRNSEECENQNEQLSDDTPLDELIRTDGTMFVPSTATEEPTEQPCTYAPPTFDSVPVLICSDTFPVFTKGVKWSNKGDKLAVVTDDKTLRIKSTSDCTERNSIPDVIKLEDVASIKEAQPVHDFAWNPSMEKDCIVTTCETQPLHLYDGKTGAFICSYVARNHLDEHISAFSVQFTRSGEKICAGFKKSVRIFEVERPGKWMEIPTWKLYQAGIVSAIDTNSENLLAVGTYCNSVAIYDLRVRDVVQPPEEGHSGGVTQVRFSFDGNLFYSGARKDSTMICRDIRNFQEILYRFPRKCETNQRLQFDFTYEEDYMCSGGTDGSCSIWNLRQLDIVDGNECRPNLVFEPHSNTALSKSSATNGVNYHPWSPVLATCSGGRVNNHWDETEDKIVWDEPYENSLKLWKFNG